MWTLVRKDLILDRRVVGLNFAMYLVMGPVFMSLLSEAPVRLIAVWAGIVGAMIPLSLVSREDKFRTAALTCSLPVTREAIVASRFVGGWLLALTGGLTVLGACYAVTLAGLGHPIGDWGGALLAGFVTIGLLLAGLLPFTMRFGFAGLLAFLVATQVLGIAAFLVAVLFAGHGALKEGLRGVIGAARSLQELFGPIGPVVSLVATVAILNVASYLLSRWIYRRRDF